MKKYFGILVFVLMAVFSLGLVSCGDDDDDEGGGASGNGSIVGTWKGDFNMEIEDLYHIKELHTYDFYTFKSDGTYVSYFVTITKYTDEAKKEFGYKDETEFEEDERGTYKLNGNKITFYPTYSDEGDYEVETLEYKVSGNKLTFTSLSGIIVSITYSKSSESEIDKYRQ